jgi:hypothetical protein
MQPADIVTEGFGVLKAKLQELQTALKQMNEDGEYKDQQDFGMMNGTEDAFMYNTASQGVNGYADSGPSMGRFYDH